MGRFPIGARTVRLSAAQATLLARVQERGRVAVEMAYGRGRQGGRVSTGAREYQAATGLVAKGLLRVTHRNKSTLPNGGYTVWVTSLTLVSAS